MRFINIPVTHIKIDMVFNTPVFLYDKQSKNRIVAFYSGLPITEDSYEEVIKKVDSGGILQVTFEELTTICNDLSCDIEEIKTLNRFLFEMIEKENHYNEVYGNKLKEKITISKSFLNNIEFIDLIKQVQAEIMCFPLSLSSEVSLAVQLAKILLIRDAFPIRCAVLSYTLAKIQKISSPETLSSIFIASLFQDLGAGQVHRDSALEDNKSIDKMYSKHPMLSMYVLSKSNLKLSNLTKRLILEHHERIDGEGYPRQKIESSIHYASHFLHASYILNSLVSGRYNSREYTWEQASQFIVKEKEIHNTRVCFPQNIIDLVSNL